MLEENITPQMKQIAALRQRRSHIGRYRERWTLDELQELKELFDKGVGISELALYFERSEQAIINKTNSMYRRIRPPKQG